MRYVSLLIPPTSHIHYNAHMPRNRKAWVGLAVCVAIAAAWVVSRYSSGGYSLGFDWAPCLEDDSLKFLDLPEFGLGPLRTSGPYKHFWLPRWGLGIVIIPLWTFFLPALAFTVWAWRRGRIPVGCCQSCGYNLTGNESGRCPECGEEM